MFQFGNFGMLKRGANEVGSAAGAAYASAERNDKADTLHHLRSLVSDCKTLADQAQHVIDNIEQDAPAKTAPAEAVEETEVGG